MYYRTTMLVIFFLLGILSLSDHIAVSQPALPQIGIAIPPRIADHLDPSYFDEFEAAHGVDVYLKPIGTGELVRYTDGTYIPLDITHHYIQTADVLLVYTDTRFVPLIDLQQTLADYYLDITPLIAADVTSYLGYPTGDVSYRHIYSS